MSKVRAGQKSAVVQLYRVECNHGCKYFLDEDQATAYFDYKTACGYDAELWLVRQYFGEQGSLVRGEQLLLEAEEDGDHITLM